MITFYGYKKCGTSRKAEKFLTEKEITYTFIDITLNPPTQDQLTAIIALADKPLKAFFNTSGVAYREGAVKDLLPTMSDDEKVALLATNGRLLKRPLITDGTKASVGFKEEEFASIWG